jgi:methylthioribose-1-phosphate isomerase
MWEFEQAGIQATLLHDSAAGSLFLDGKVDAVVVGADRIAANGDTANKIGTSVLAMLADKCGVPFYVAAPRSTIDPRTKDGKAIPIEVRNGEELTSINGNRIAPAGALTYSPAFDVTPAELISAIVTEGGVLRKPYQFAEIAGTQ